MHKAIRHIKNNRYYNHHDILWFIIYLLAFNILAGINNSFGALALGNATLLSAFTIAFINQTLPGIPINFFYARIIRHFSKMSYPIILANLFSFFVCTAELGWHLFAGTANPVITVIPFYVLSFALTNTQLAHMHHVHKKSKLKSTSTK